MITPIAAKRYVLSEKIIQEKALGQGEK